MVRLYGLCPDVRAAPHRLAGSELARATCGTIRLKLLKIGAQVTNSVRRVKIAFAYPTRDNRFLPWPMPG